MLTNNSIDIFPIPCLLAIVYRLSLHNRDIQYNMYGMEIVLSAVHIMCIITCDRVEYSINKLDTLHALEGIISFKVHKNGPRNNLYNIFYYYTTVKT